MENTGKIKGVILCPICHKGKIIAYEGASGKASVGCQKCPGLVLVDYDTMTAVPGTAQKDAAGTLTGEEITLTNLTEKILFALFHPFPVRITGITEEAVLIAVLIWLVALLYPVFSVNAVPVATGLGKLKKHPVIGYFEDGKVERKEKEEAEKIFIRGAEQPGLKRREA